MAKFTYLDELKKAKWMIEVGEDKANDLVYFLDGQRIQVNSKFLYLFISTLDPKIITKYLSKKSVYKNVYASFLHRRRQFYFW